MTFHMIDELLLLLLAVLFIWFILAMIAPGVFARFFSKKRRSYSFLVLIVGIALFFFGAYLNDKYAPGQAEMHQKVDIAQKATAQEKADGIAEIKAILNQTAQQRLEGTNTLRYQSWGEGNIPQATNVYWEVLVSNPAAFESIVFVQFSDSNAHWINWDQLGFSTDEGSWTYTVNTTAEKHPDHKDTQTVNNGKFEYLNTDYDKVAQGIDLLVAGHNPKITFKGSVSSYEFAVPPATIEQLKVAQKLNHDLAINLNIINK